MKIEKPNEKAGPLGLAGMLMAVFAALAAAGGMLAISPTVRSRLGPYGTIVCEVLVCAAAANLVYALVTDKGDDIPAAAEPSCLARQIPAVFGRLKDMGKEGSFVMFTIPTDTVTDPDKTHCVQFSIERGYMGFDWLLTDSPLNLRDRERFEHFATALGYQIEEREMNEMKYLRVEVGDLVSLCQAVIGEFYGITRDAKLDMMIDGISWP